MKIVMAVLLASCCTFVLEAEEGFGKRKMVVSMTRTVPPVISVPPSRVEVVVTTPDAADVEPLRRATQEVLARDSRYATPNGVNVRLTLAAERVKVEKTNSSRAGHKRRVQIGSTPNRTSTESVVPTANIPNHREMYGVIGEIAGTYRITDSHGKLLAAGRFEEQLDDWARYASEEKLRAGLLQRAAAGVAGAMLRKHESVSVFLPRGSFESLIPLAEAGQWDHYLAAVETMPPMQTLTDEAYRQYALGIAKEAVAYTADRDRALALLREAVEHYLSAIEENPNEPLFREPETVGEATVVPPLKRVTASAKAYAAWRP